VIISPSGQGDVAGRGRRPAVTQLGSRPLLRGVGEWCDLGSIKRTAHARWSRALMASKARLLPAPMHDRLLEPDGAGEGFGDQNPICRSIVSTSWRAGRAVGALELHPGMRALCTECRGGWWSISIRAWVEFAEVIEAAKGRPGSNLAESVMWFLQDPAAGGSPCQCGDADADGASR